METIREATHRKVAPPKGKVQRKQKKADKSKRSVEEYRRWTGNGGEPFDSPPSSDSSNSDTEEESRRPKRSSPVKPQIDLSILAALSRQDRRRTQSESDSEKEDIVSKPRRGPARQTKGDRITVIQLLQNMKFPGAKDNNMVKAKMGG